VQPVGHNFGGNFPLFVEESGAEVEVEDAFAIIQLGDDAVDGRVFLRALH
jgi:hypothetical protein